MGGTSVSAPKANYGKDINKLLGAFQKTMPGILSFEDQFRSMFQNLNVKDSSSFMFGGDGQSGIMNLGQQATQQSQEQLTAARQAELQSMQQQAGLTRGVAESLSPEQQRMVAASTQEAQRARNASYNLTPQEQRMSDQSSRESFGARGMLGSMGSVASEVLGRDQFLGAKRAEAAQAENNAFNMAGQFYTQPGYQMLGSQPLSYQTGQQQLGLGLNAIGAGTPQLFPTGTALNLGAAERANAVAAQAAQAQANASTYSGIAQGLGSAAGGALSAKTMFMCIPDGEKITTPDGDVAVKDLMPGDIVTGYDGKPTTVLQKHIYKEDPEAIRFVRFTLEDGKSFSVCDMHKVEGLRAGDYSVGDYVGGLEITSIEVFGGIITSYDILTGNSGYRMAGIPVNSMIEEMAAYATSIQ
jgi:hypothetical protein